MPGAADFLARLGLDSSADERAIRHVYAGLFKRIDHVTDAGRFQPCAKTTKRPSQSRFHPPSPTIMVPAEPQPM